MPLPVPPDTMRVTMRAELVQAGVPVEEAQFGFWGVRQHFSGNGTDWADDVVTVAEGIRDAWVEHVTKVSFWSSAVQMRTVRVDHLDAANGKTLDQGTAVFEGDTAWAGTATSSLPWETTVCVSLYGYTPGTFTTNKPRKRGRMYLPPPAAVAASGGAGQVFSADLSELSANLGAFFNDVQGINMGTTAPPNDSDYFDLRVVSRGTPEKPLAPTSTPIILIQMDSRIDSQRRREQSQPALTTASVEIEHS